MCVPTCPSSSIWLTLPLQALLVRFAWYRWVSNPISNFIDLAFLCNISIILFDEQHSGYYVHGRNQAQHSDTDLKCVGFRRKWCPVVMQVFNTAGTVMQARYAHTYNYEA